MRKPKLFRLLFLLTLLSTFHQYGNSQAVWQERVANGGMGFRVCNVPGGGFVVVSHSSLEDIYLARFDALGTLVDRSVVLDGLWSSQGYDVKATTDGGYIVAGYGSGSLGYGDAILIKFDAGLNVTWRKCYGTYDRQEAAYSVVEVEDGYVFTGEAEGRGEGSTALPIIKVNLSGTLVWSKIYIDAGRIYGNPGGRQIIRTSDGGFAIAANWGAYPAIYDMVLAKFDGNGDLQWIKGYGGHGYPVNPGFGTSEQSFSLAQTDDDGYALLGYAWSSGPGDQVFLVRTDAAGNPVFQREYGMSGSNEQGYELVITPEGDFVITGYTWGSSSKMLLMKVLSNGSLAWANGYDNFDLAYGLCQAPDNGFAMVGSRPWDDLGIVKTDVNGFAGCATTKLTFNVSDVSIDPMEILDFEDLIDWTSGGHSVGSTKVLLTPEVLCCDIGLMCAPSTTNLSQVHKTIGRTSRDDFGRGIEQMDNGGFLVAGWDEVPGSPATDRDATLTALDRSGRWCWTVNFELGGDEYGHAVVPIEEDCGGILLAGAHTTNGDLNFLLVKTDGYGAPYWTKSVGGNRDEVAYAAIEVSGGYVAAGYTETFGSGAKDIYVVKVDPSGSLLWTRVLGGSEDDVAYGLYQADNGDVLLTGKSLKSGESSEFYVARLNSATGTVVWKKRYGMYNWEEIGYDIWEEPLTGNIYVVGSGRGGPNNQLDPIMLVVDANGTFLTEVWFPTDEADEAFSIAPASNGNLYIVGYTQSFGAVGKDALLIEAELDGSFIAAMRYGKNGTDVGRSVFTSAEGRPVIIGESNSFGNGKYDMYFLKLNNLMTSCYEDGGMIYPVANIPATKGGFSETTGGSLVNLAPFPENLIEVQGTVCDYEEDDGPGGGTGKVAIPVDHSGTVQAEFGVVTYPNPTTGNVHFVLSQPSQGAVELTISDATGRTVRVMHTTQLHGEIDLSHLGNGLYFLHASDGKNQAVSKIQLLQSK